MQARSTQAGPALPTQQRKARKTVRFIFRRLMPMPAYPGMGFDDGQEMNLTPYFPMFTPNDAGVCPGGRHLQRWQNR